jgi:MUN domain
LAGDFGVHWPSYLLHRLGRHILVLLAQKDSAHRRMSTSSTQSRGANTRISSVQRSERLSRNTSRVRPKPVSYNEAYTYALRVAYLHHLLQPRPKRKQYMAAPKPAATTNSISELVKDFSILKDSRSAKLPHGFMSPLEKRLQGVLMGKERLPGYNDAAIKRTFAEAYTAFTEEGFRKRMDKERRVEDLVLIFYSNATKALQKGKSSDDDTWKSMVDRHVALFVRIISNTLKDHGNDKDRPELMSRLATLEKKLLTDDQDLTVSSGQKDTFVEVVVPLSYDVKDMPMVQVVAKIFGLRNSQVQSDIDANRNLWTEEAALTDLKSYQHCLNADSKRTLRSDDFDLEEAYQAWKKAEGPILSQMILDILHVKPELTKNPSGGSKPFVQSKPISTVIEEHTHSNPSRTSSPLDLKSPHGLDRPIDFSSLSFAEDQTARVYLEEATYTFIPPDPRAYYRCILMHAATFDHLQAAQETDGPMATPPFSKQSLELLTELSTRWRIPQFSRFVLFLDVTSQRFMDQEIGLEELDSAFEFVKNPPVDMKRAGTHSQSLGVDLNDPSYWTVHDLALYRQTLSNLHDTLLRDLYDLLQHCFETKPPSVGPVMLILENHIHSNSSFSKSPEQLQEYTQELERGLREKAAAVYRSYLEAEVPQNQEEWQFSHVVKLGKAVVKLCQRIQKRYQKNPTIMGVNPLTILVETMFPSFENDAGELIQRILLVARSKDSEVDLQDGFDLYRELVEIRRIHRDALPDVPFAFHIEGCLDDFVWRWIRLAETKMIGLVDEAISQDKFEVRAEHPTDEERHSVSIIDIFRLFNETTDQIFKLGWDDDIHHAKFMTALSKSFGIGLARYCEVLEQKFTSEMSRATPAQEAALSRSKQDWMRLAKEAWNNKEKIEPFQFYPEVSIYILFAELTLTTYSRW